MFPKISMTSGGSARVTALLWPLTLLLSYMATIPAANLLITHFGIVDVGFGLTAPAAVFTVGVALVLRDLVHEQAGRWAVLAAIASGTGLSYLLADPALALASAVAFAVAELADMAVYSQIRAHGLRRTLLLAPAKFSAHAARVRDRRPAPDRRSRLLTAVAVSNTVGLAVDSVLFLHLAFGSMAYLPGQLLAKAEMTLAAVLVLHLISTRRPRAA